VLRRGRTSVSDAALPGIKVVRSTTAIASILENIFFFFICSYSIKFKTMLDFIEAYFCIFFRPS
jgi:hypothetical protein